MDWVGIIGLIVTLVGLIAGAIWWAFRQGRGVGVAETELKHEDESLNERVGSVEKDVTQLKSDIESINSKLEGPEFWNQMHLLLKEVQGGTKRYERPSD